MAGRQSYGQRRREGESRRDHGTAGVDRRTAVRGGKSGQSIGTRFSTTIIEHGFPGADLQVRHGERKRPRENVFYTITEGDQQFVRDVLTTGCRPRGQRSSAKGITLKPGDPFRRSKQTRDPAALLRSRHLRPRRYGHPKSGWETRRISMSFTTSMKRTGTRSLWASAHKLARFGHAQFHEAWARPAAPDSARRSRLTSAA